MHYLKMPLMLHPCFSLVLVLFFPDPQHLYRRSVAENATPHIKVQEVKGDTLTLAYVATAINYG